MKAPLALEFFSAEEQLELLENSEMTPFIIQLLEKIELEYDILKNKLILVLEFVKGSNFLQN